MKCALQEERCFLLLICLKELVLLSYGFNLDYTSVFVFRQPTPMKRASYFGFSVSLTKDFDDVPWLLIGAPRANSSISPFVLEPGTIFKCNLQTFINDTDCHELVIDTDQGHRSSASYIARRDNGWLGASMDSQLSNSDRRVSTVCSPRWKNAFYRDSYLISGACYWFNSSFSQIHKRIPLTDFEKQNYYIREINKNVFYHSHGQAGISLHMPDDEEEILIGAPGILNWRGSVVVLHDASSTISGGESRRRKRQSGLVSPQTMYLSKVIPNPFFTEAITDFDLFGYSVTSGKFNSLSKLQYAAGAPRAAEAIGKVLVFSLPPSDELPLENVQSLIGTQLGEYFGASLCAPDINGDGLNDLVVGAPLHSMPNATDCGAVYVFIASERGFAGSYSRHAQPLLGSILPFARFGTAVATPGDLDYDGYQDVLVGAPYENDQGAIYLYVGGLHGLKSKYSQKLVPKDFGSSGSQFLGFGFVFSRGVDVDQNGYADIAVGSYQSGHAVVIRSLPVVRINGTFRSSPERLSFQDTKFSLNICIKYDGYRVPSSIEVKVLQDMQSESLSTFPRARFGQTGDTKQEFIISLKSSRESCRTHEASVKPDPENPFEPIVIKASFRIVENNQRKKRQKDSSTLHAPLTKAVLHPDDVTRAMFSLPFFTGCEEDGNPECTTDLSVVGEFPDYGVGGFYVIGSTFKLQFSAEAINVGESAFLPYLNLTVPFPIGILPTSATSCQKTIYDYALGLMCRLNNPMKHKDTEKMEFTLDTRRLSDDIDELAVGMEVGSDSHSESNPQDNVNSVVLRMKSYVNIKVHGSAKDENLQYNRVDPLTINASYPLSTNYTFQVQQRGVSPISEVRVILDIPYYSGGTKLLELFAPTTDLNGQPFQFTLSGATFAEWHGVGVAWNDSSKGQPNPQFREDILVETPEEGRSAENRTKVIDCREEFVRCATLRFTVFGPWKRHDIAMITLPVSFNMHAIAQLIWARSGAEVNILATANAIKNKVAFSGDSHNSGTATATVVLQPGYLPTEGAKWWMILLAVLAGIVLLALIAYGLYKVGFFQRKEKEEMEAHQAILASQPTDDLGNTNL